MACHQPPQVRPAQAGSADDVARELEQLRDRFRKTTNALASAAHDLKTPLAILNGYIDLLRSQKLGPLNDRQREVMATCFRADNACSSSFRTS
jgi:signal transduction histidine kinase